MNELKVLQALSNKLFDVANEMRTKVDHIEMKIASLELKNDEVTPRIQNLEDAVSGETDAEREDLQALVDQIGAI